MEIIPVIDLKGGQVVHAQGGRRDEYRPIRTPLSPSSDPSDVLAGLLRLGGFPRLYAADLDAIEGRGDHAAVFATLAKGHDVEIWVDNGLGGIDAARSWLAREPGCLVIGSESQTGPDTLRALRDETRVVLSLDFRGDAFVGPSALLNDPDLWPARVIVMTLARVGAGGGPDRGRVESVARRAGGRRIYAAGGVRHAGDLRDLAGCGACGALVATALHDGGLTAADIAALAGRAQRD